jgi:hypothetical protein
MCGTMICDTCRYGDPPGFVVGADGLEPCPDCGGTRVAHCCDGLICNEAPEVSLARDAAPDATPGGGAPHRPEAC